MPAEVLWFLDKPVSNSGKLKKLITDIANQNSWPWSVQLTFSPDKQMMISDNIIATTDSIILDNCTKWINLASDIIKEKLPRRKVLDLSGAF
jgi:hypothetical protein